MDLVPKILEIAIIIRDNISMDFLKVSASISGLMEATIREISSRDSEVGMVFGRWTPKMMNRIHVNSIKDIIQWIKNLGMESMNGKMDGHIKAISKMIIVMAMGNCMIWINVSIRVFGKMDKKLMDKE